MPSEGTAGSSLPFLESRATPLFPDRIFALCPLSLCRVVLVSCWLPGVCVPSAQSMSRAAVFIGQAGDRLELQLL